MAREIERKFLVCGDGWRGQGPTEHLRQGYLCVDPARTVRVRLRDGVGTLTIKGLTQGIARAEFEWRIDAAEAAELLERHCLSPLLEKRRTQVEHDGVRWEVDEFLGDNAGLVVAEVELEHEAQTFALPAWVGAEVSSDPRYFNSNLQQRPFRSW